MDHPVVGDRSRCESLIRSAGLIRAAYWLVGGVIVSYVALCAPNRDSVWGADAWEHHRAVVVLSHQLWRPGNPTYATDEPSIRYSPYSVALALICRATGADAYHVLTAAAVVNTALLVVSLHLLLRVYGMTAIGPYVLVVMVSLYGSAPGYASTFALADLPWHQVNPSALSFALAPLMWAWLRSTAAQPRAGAAVAGLALLGALATLTHGHTGVFAFIGLAAVAVSAPAAARVRLLRRFAFAGLGALLLCLAWPWFSFLAAVFNGQDRTYWFNAFITKHMLTVWCAPALFCFPVLLSLRRNELARFCLIGAATCYLLVLIGILIQSPVLGRLPLPALILLHIPIAQYVHQHGLFWPQTWRKLARDLFSFNPAVAAPASIKVILVAVLAYCLLPQLATIPSDPALARSYVAPMLGKADKQFQLRSKFKDLLQPVGPRDVVLSDLVTSWPVPSFRGRIVAALHYESFTPDQTQRQEDLEAFFAAEDDAVRRQILEQYGVKWIILNTASLSPYKTRELLEPRAVVNEVDSFILMDAQRWLEARS